VAYNFDSFGHHGGLPQLLVQSGYRMYVHMRPQSTDLALPADLYRWRGVDGSEVLALRIDVGLYHTERDNLQTRLRDGVELALRLGRDVGVFWGLGDHGGGATREDLATIDRFARSVDSSVEVLHSTPERLYERLAPFAESAPVVEGDIQRVFTGCYTSLSRVKRRARASLARLVQCETLRAASWWLLDQEYPEDALGDAWRDHLFNDFHDILPGSCTAPAEADALDLYGKVDVSLRRMRLGALSAFSRAEPTLATLPVAVLHSSPAGGSVPVEVEFMVDHRPLWEGTWHTRIFDAQGRELPSQEEQPDSRLQCNGWRRKLCFLAPASSVGASHYGIERFEGPRTEEPRRPALDHALDPQSGLIHRLDAGDAGSCLAGPLLEPWVVDDPGDSWGTGLWSYRDVVGRFSPEGEARRVEAGPIRTITESRFRFASSRLVLHTVAYADWPVIELRLHLLWNEPRRRLKLVVPTVFREAGPLCEIPGGSVARPSDGDEHVHGRWLLLSGECEHGPAALGVVQSGQHGIDCKEGTVSLSVLRSAAYCHERREPIDGRPGVRYMDLGEHELRVLVTAGAPNFVRSYLPGLADWLDAPPVALAHWPFGAALESPGDNRQGRKPSTLLQLTPPSVRLVACKRSRDGAALIVRIHDTSGLGERAQLRLERPPTTIELTLRPFELKTLRVDRDGAWREADPVEET
jgi:alpha-mannosidase